MKSPQTSVILVGPMGVGKTTIGKKLAHEWGLPFIDTDNVVIEKHGAIDTIFENQGEQAFRQFETEALKSSLTKIAVIATGGGVVLSQENRKLLKAQLVIYLKTNGKHMASRIAGSKRPLLQNGMSDWNRIYEQRKELYSQVATHTIDTSDLPLKSIVLEIRGLIS
jgi:shikimate kinase